MLDSLTRWWQTTRRQIRIEAKRQAEAREKAAIARAFNDRYTYRREWVPDAPRLPGTAMHGLNPRAGYAWMCPECNRVHHPIESSVFSGLQYPRCCSTPLGDRLALGIKAHD